MTRPGVAVVGAGFIGPIHVEALGRLGLPVVGILGSSPEKGREAASALGLEKAYPTLAELLADPAVHAVHIATPNRFHHEQCRQALAAGKHVICEKPLAMNSTETAELVELARRSPLIAAVNYNIRFYPLCIEARERITEGELGDVFHVTGSYEQDWLLHESDFNWRVLPELGGALRAVADIGTHWLDLVTWITGLRIERVSADLRTFLPTRQRSRTNMETFQGKVGGECKTHAVLITTEDYGAGLLHFRGGARGCFHVSQVTAGRKNCLRFEIAGSKGSLAWNSERPNELRLGHRDRPNEILTRDPSLLHERARRSTATPGGHNEGFADTFKQLFRSVYSSIETGTPADYPSFADGHREVVLCEAVLKSHLEQRWVDLK